MKILFDHQIFDAQAYGGISRYFFELIKRAAHSPLVQPQVFMGAFINQYGTESLAPQLDHFWGISRPVIPRTGRVFGHVNQALFQYRTKSWAPDIYHQTYFRELKPRFKAKRVVTVYDMIHEIYPEFFPSSDPTREQKRYSVENADRVIAISESTKRDVIKFYGTSPDKIDVIYLANSLQKVTYTERNSRPYFLYVGARGGYKNFNFLLEAFAKIQKSLPEAHDLIAYGGGAFSEQEHLQIAALKLTEQVQHAGGGDSTLASLYQGCVAFVYPSLYEGFGIPILEAMHLGAPVVISQGGSLAEVGGQAASYFKEGSVESLGTVLVNLASKPTLRAEYAAKGARWESTFSWDRTFNETVDCYKRLHG